MTLRKLLMDVSLTVAASLASLLICEGVARTVLNPADYLSVDMVKDSVLGAVPSLSTKAGLDAWGFRNRRVPEHADIVAIGDSHTYGNTATMEDSWPYVVGRLTNRSVYNMGLGGYGPNQYFHLLKTRALGLKPRIIICGIYMGDDFENAFSITYGLEHWTYLRGLPSEQTNPDIWRTSDSVSWHKWFRVWMSGHSVAYQLVVHGPLMGLLQGEAQIRNASRLYDSATSLIVPENHILEAFLPKAMVSRLDQDNPAVREGMRITLELIREMNDICRQQGIQFLILVIPTKESVFADYFERNPNLPLSNVVLKQAANERLAREATFRALADSAISYLDLLPAMKRFREEELYARTAADMHPNKNGYRVIGEAVFEAMKQGVVKNVDAP